MNLVEVPVGGKSAVEGRVGETVQGTASNREDFSRECQRICADRGWTFESGSVEIPCANERRQRVAFTFFFYEDREIVRLHSIIGSTKKINSTRLNTALSLNFRLPYGALAIHKNDLVMVDTLMLKEASHDEISTAFSYLAETADHYEATMFGPDVH